MLSKLPDVLALMYSASTRVSTVALTLRYSADRQLLEYVSERYVEQISAKPMRLTDGKSVDPEGERYEYRWHIWWQKDRFWRIDRLDLSQQHVQTDMIDGGHVGPRVGNGSRFQKGAAIIGGDSGNDPENAKTSRSLDVNKAASEFAPLDPSFLLGSHDLSLSGEADLLGRRVLKVHATPRPDREAALDGLFWSSADSYELAVDTEFGILLAYSAHLGQRRFAEVSAERIVVNSPIPEEVRVRSAQG